MGNVPLTVGISVESKEKNSDGNPIVASGSTVRGKVYLQVSGKEALVNVTSLNVRVRGVEQSVVHYETTLPTNNDKSNPHAIPTHNHTASDAASLFHVDFPLKTFAKDKPLKRGQFEFPFEVTLPPNLPASMEVRHGRSKCQVYYDVEARLVRGGTSGDGGNFNNFALASRATKVLHVRGTPRPSDDVLFAGRNATGLVMPPQTEAIRSWFCFPHGSMSLLSSHVDRTVLAAGDVARVTFQARNDSTTPVQEVLVTLTEQIRWKAQNKTETFSRTVAKLSAPPLEELQQQTLVPLIGSRREKDDFGTRQERLLEQPPEKTAQDLVAAEQAATSAPYRAVQLHVPPDVRESYKGRLMEINHLLSVRLVTGYLTTSPESTVKIPIRSPPPSSKAPAKLLQATPSAPAIMDDPNRIPQAEVTVLPDNWSAVTADMVTIPIAHAVLVEDSSSAPVGSNVPSSSPSPSVSPPSAAISGAGTTRNAVASSAETTFREVERELSAANDPVAYMTQVSSSTTSSKHKVLSNLSADEYGTLVLSVSASPSSPLVARQLGFMIQSNQKFLCSHVMACAVLLPPSAPHRLAILESVAPMALDWRQNRSLVLDALTAEERVQLQSVVGGNA